MFLSPLGAEVGRRDKCKYSNALERLEQLQPILIYILLTTPKQEAVGCDIPNLLGGGGKG